MVSISTGRVEQNYAQLYLEAMTVDYALLRFRTYLIGSPHENTIVTNHLTPSSVFNGKRSRSIGTERIKLRHQEILLYLKFANGHDNQVDYLSRHVTQRKSVSKSERERERGRERERERERGGSKDLSKLLYTLLVTPILDALVIREIAENTQTVTTLTKLRCLIHDDKTYIPKNLSELQSFRNILS